jgi:FkbM family methyltransferase
MSKLFKIFVALVKPFVGSGIGRVKILADIYQFFAIRLLPKENKVIETQGFKIQIVNNGYVGDIHTELLFRGVHEPATTRIFKTILKQGDNVVDVGANIGYFSLLSAKLIGNKGIVYAFEPNKDNIDQIYKNCELNNFYNIKPYKVALSNQVGQMKFYTSSKESAHHSLIKTKEHDGQTIVGVAKLDDLLVMNYLPIKLIKTDTEGNELAVLQGGEQTILKNKDIKLIVEIYEDGLNACKVSRDDIWYYITDYLKFYYIYMIDDYKDKVERIVALPKRKMASNLLCSREAVEI